MAREAGVVVGVGTEGEVDPAFVVVDAVEVVSGHRGEVPRRPLDAEPRLAPVGEAAPEVDRRSHRAEPENRRVVARGQQQAERLLPRLEARRPEEAVRAAERLVPLGLELLVLAEAEIGAPLGAGRRDRQPVDAEGQVEARVVLQVVAQGETELHVVRPPAAALAVDPQVDPARAGRHQTVADLLVEIEAVDALQVVLEPGGVERLPRLDAHQLRHRLVAELGVLRDGDAGDGRDAAVEALEAGAIGLPGRLGERVAAEPLRRPRAPPPRRAG